MPKRKKKASEMTDQELERRIFPKPVLEELKRIANPDDPKQVEKIQKKRSSHP